MSSEPQVHFCNVCNQSIPESALSQGAAVRIDGRIVPLATQETAAPASPASGVGRSLLVGAVLAVLVAIAGAAIYVDWRLTQSEGRVRGEVADVGRPLARQREQLDALDRRLAATVVRTDLTDLTSGLEDARELVRGDIGTVRETLDARLAAVDQLTTAIAAVQEAHVQEMARLALVQDDLRALARDLAELRARPVATPVAVEPARGSVGPATDRPAGGLPPELAHWVAQLGDANDGVRFEAVDQLLQSKDQRVYPLLAPLAKDPDLFVRRLVLEGFAEHRAPQSVDTLIEALADPEEVVRHTAFLGLKRLTGEDIAFDPAASSEQRTAMQRRWSQWWERARDTF